MDGIFRRLATWVTVGVLAIFGVAMVASPVFAEKKDNKENCVKTSILKNDDDGYYCDEEGNGSGIFYILGIVLDILTYGVGSAATIGIAISGIQYATAGDNVGQVQKSKTRILHIVIGLVIYALFWGLLQFLLPGGLYSGKQ